MTRDESKAIEKFAYRNIFAGGRRELQQQQRRQWPSCELLAFGTFDRQRAFAGRSIWWVRFGVLGLFTLYPVLGNLSLVS